MSTIDILILVLGLILVIGFGIYKGKSSSGSEGYFLAGRGLPWWLIGFSLIAANISTEQFVGMSGSASDYLGMAIASYEWMAAITLVVVAFVFLPKFLSTGIYTVPEFLEYRYSSFARFVMALITMVTLVVVNISAVIYSGALLITTLYPSLDLLFAGVIIALLAAVYVAVGGLKACAWTDLVWGSALIVGGGVITYLAFTMLGQTPISELAYTADIAAAGLTDASSGSEKFFAINSDKLHMVLPRTDENIPWTALVVGLWIPNFFYWGLNQYITQRTLGSKSLAEGQKGIVFAAALKLIVPFVIVFPGIIAFNLFSGDMKEIAADDSKIQEAWVLYEELKDDPAASGTYTLFKYDRAFETAQPEKAAEIAAYNAKVESLAEAAGSSTSKETLLLYKYDSAFGLLLKRLLPEGSGLLGFVLLAITGAVISSLASMLNAASTIFSMDIYRKYFDKDATDQKLVTVGRVCVAVFVSIGCALTTVLTDPNFGGIFKFIQEFQGFISPGILGIFVFAFAVKKAPRNCGVAGLITSPVVYGALFFFASDVAFLDRMAITIFSVFLVLGVLTLMNPLKENFKLPNQAAISLESSKIAAILGWCVVFATIGLYIVFW
ncbi:sodium:solute symporter family transporter [Pelagicoccus mobilis]|uniref:Sodium/solute symporter n=1 Tax=Pelagicoccus mobilis TaxID=415221 RepID=A0A934VPT6_9BACT|nr:sodium/solute symporter [Pelagicoccus mobilis]MBK1875873.1 sodium/solute symporter [Pelagicoccus mobilis]